MSTSNFNEELRVLLNKHSIDAKVGIPDFILSTFLENTLDELSQAQSAASHWRNN